LPKQKTHKGAAKRFKVTATGKVKRGHSMAGHNFTCKTTKQKRGLRKSALVEGKFEKNVKGMLHN